MNAQINQIHKLEAYLEEILGLGVVFVPWSGAQALPIYLRDGYDFYEFTLWDRQCLLAYIKGGRLDDTPGVIKKQWEQIGQKQGRPVVMGFDELEPYERKRLMEQGVQFVAANRQLFIPMLGVDLEDYRAVRAKEKQVEKLGIVAQKIILKALYDPEWLNTHLANEIAVELNCSKMTVSRAINELEHHQLIKVDQFGREKRMHLAGHGEEVWRNALQTLQNPVKSRVYFWGNVDQMCCEGLRIAGETALAERTMLGAPAHRIYALYANRWKNIKDSSCIEEIDRPEPGCIELELWRYDPAKFSKNDAHVDILSLVLTLRGRKDERVLMAVDQLERDLPWR